MNTKIYKIIFGLLFLMLVVFIFQPAFNGKKIVLVYAQTGTPISDCIGLQDMKLDLTADYYLTQSFSCSATAPGDQGGGDIWTDNLGFEPIGQSAPFFSGSFDGQGNTITDLFIYRTGESFVGLFGIIFSDSVISDIDLVDVNITGLNFVGGLVGFSFGTITTSSTSGDVSGNDEIGALVGHNSNGVINNSCSSADVTGNGIVGGLAGHNSNGVINNSCSSGDVSGTTRVGGLVGWNDSGNISNSYSVGFISGSGGGLVGSNTGTCIDSFWDTQTSGQLSGVCGTGLSTADMVTQDTFDPPWDFKVIPIWKMISNSGFFSYPCLQWQADSTCILSSITASALGNFLMGMTF